MQKYSYLQGLKDGVSIGLGYLSVSFTFGMLTASSGIPVWIAVFISMSNLTSAGQFAGLNIMLSGGSFFEMAITQLVINLRYALMSISLSQKLDKSVTLLHRFAISFFNTDEIFAVASAKNGEVGTRFMYGLATAPFIGWTLGTFLGAALSGILPSAIRSCLGIAIYAMFVAIIIPPAKKQSAITLVIIISVVLSCLFSFMPLLNKLSSGFTVIICSVVAAATGAIIKPIDIDESEARANE